jgi:hypothetical protein
MSEMQAGRQLSPEQAAAAMVAEARQRGLALTGPNGLLKLFTRNVLETALHEEMTEHFGHEKHRSEPTGIGRARWTMRWKPVLDAFAITFGDRWPVAETY